MGASAQVGVGEAVHSSRYWFPISFYRHAESPKCSGSRCLVNVSVSSCLCQTEGENTSLVFALL